jgi:hypothetical protein
MMGIGFTMRALLPVLLLLPLKGPPSAPTPSKSPSGQYGIPRLAPGQIWVSSVPVGLEVRAGENPNARKVLGRTPLLLKAGEVGGFVTVSIRKKEYQGEFPNQMEFADFTADKNHSMSVSDGANQVDVSRAITYKAEFPKKNTVIALFQSRNVTLSELSHLYPPGLNFQFSDEAPRQLLSQKGVPPDFIHMGIQLLHRGGKVGLPGRAGWLIAEVSSSGKVDVWEHPVKPPN